MCNPGIVSLSLLLLCMSTCGCNPPIIHYSHNMRILKIPMGTDVGDVIYRIRASDADNDTITFDVLEDYGKSVISFKSLNPNEANVILNKQLELDEGYNLTIYASDAHESTYIESVVMSTAAPIEWLSPILVDYNPIYVFENATLNTSLTLVKAYDREDSKLPVTFELLEQSEHFQVRYIFGPRGMSTAELVLVRPLDYELQNLYTLTVLALNAKTNEEVDTRNVHTLKLSIIVNDVQDTPPIFFNLPQVINLENTYRPNEIIFRVCSEDGDTIDKRDVTYSLDEETSKYFEVNSQGQLSPMVDYDQLSGVYATDQPLRLEVKSNEVIIGDIVTDPTTVSSTSELIILFNFTNRSPRFSSSQLMGAIDEHSPSGSTIHWMVPQDAQASDFDLGLNGTFRLHVQDEHNMFSIQPQLAYQSTHFVLVVNDTSQLDYESRHNITLVILATDQSREHPESANITCTIVIIDTNDHHPQFSENVYRTNILENIQAGTIVTTISATDVDSGPFGQIAYTGLRGMFASNFHLDPSNGTITLIDAKDIDREIVTELVLTIEARDELGKGNLNTTELYITVLDVNDNPPIFLQPFYIALIDPQAKRLIHPLQLNAIDIDEPNTANSLLNYEILHGNQDHLLTIDPISGNISLNALSDLDKLHWQHTPINITVRAFDMGIPQMSSLINVYIFFMNRSQKVRTLFVTNNKLDLTHSVTFFENKLNGITGGTVKLEEFKHFDGKKRSTRIAIVTSVEYGNETIVDLDKLPTNYQEMFYNETSIETSNKLREHDNSVEPRGTTSNTVDNSITSRTLDTGQLDGTIVLIVVMLLLILFLSIILIYLLCLVSKKRKKNSRSKSKKASKIKRNAISNDDNLVVARNDQLAIIGERENHSQSYELKEEKKYETDNQTIVYSEYKHIRCPKTQFTRLNTHEDNNHTQLKTTNESSTHPTIPKQVDSSELIDRERSKEDADAKETNDNDKQIITNDRQNLTDGDVYFNQDEYFDADGNSMPTHKKSIFTITYNNICKRENISSGSEQV